MVSGVLNQLLFLGNRIEAFVGAGQAAQALASAHLALNLLQYSCPEDRWGPDGQEAEGLRAGIESEPTRLDALKRIAALARGERDAVENLPALWRREAKETELRKNVWTWRTSLGTALFRTLREMSSRYSPTGQAGGFLFRVQFDPRSGLIESIDLPHLFPPEPIQRNSESQVSVFFHYNRDLRRFFLHGRSPESLAVFGKSREAAGERAPAADWGDLAEPVRSLIEAVHGSQPVYPRFKILRVQQGGSVVHRLDPSLARSNARYARRALPSPSEAAMGMTMRWTEAMGAAVRSGDPYAFERLMPLPEIFVSVAENGAFIGFLYQMPDEGSPRGTVYEIGSPELGAQARLHYELYRIDGSTESIRVPVGARWADKPNRLQKRAMEQWVLLPEFEEIRKKGTLIRRSV